MHPILWTCFIILTTVYFIWPLQQYAKERERREFENDFRLFKLRTVRRRYKVLQNLSNREIEELFDLDSIYNNIR